MLLFRALWAVLLAVPTLVFVGWVTNNVYLKSIVPGATAMSPVSMTCFVLLAVMIAAVDRKWKHAKLLTLVVCGLTITMGALILIRAIFGFDSHIDQVLFADRLDGNRVAPNTAFNFLLVSLVPLIYYWRPRYKLAMHILLLTSAFISALSLIGYMFGLRALFGVAQFNPMAIHTATCFLLVVLLMSPVFVKVRALYVNRRIVLSLALAFMIPILANLAAERSIRGAALAQSQSVETETIILSIEKLRVALVDAETSQRGYLLTNRDDYLVPYAQAKQSVTNEIDALNRQFRNDPVSVSAFSRVAQSSRQKLAELDQAIALKQQGKTAALVALIDSDASKKPLYTARSGLTSIEVDWANRLKNLRAENTARQIRTLWSLAISIAIDVVLLIIAFLSIQRTSRQQQLSYEIAEAETQKLETLLASIGDGVFVIDMNERVVLFNPGAEKISGFNSYEVLGRPYREVLDFTYEKSGKLNRQFIEIALSGKPAEMANHTQLRHKKGHQVPVADSAAPFFSGDGKTVNGVIVVFRDVTKDRKLDQAKDDFVSLASHQLRTPATAVKLFLGLILDGYSGEVSKLSKEQRNYMQMAYESNEEGLQLINALLDIARIEAGTAEFLPEEVDMRDIVKQVASRQRMLVKQRSQELKLDLPETVTMAKIDRNLFMTALDNLINNASKYTPEGGHIKVKVSHRAKHLAVDVIDDGKGIAVDEVDKLFQRFSRIDVSTNGTGLGLYLIKLVTELHKGKVDVKSKLGSGSTFSIILPIGEQHAKKDTHS